MLIRGKVREAAQKGAGLNWFSPVIVACPLMVVVILPAAIIARTTCRYLGGPTAQRRAVYARPYHVVRRLHSAGTPTLLAFSAE